MVNDCLFALARNQVCSVGSGDRCISGLAKRVSKDAETSMSFCFRSVVHRHPPTGLRQLDGLCNRGPLRKQWWAVVGNSPNYGGRTRRLIGLIVDNRFGIAAWTPIYFNPNDSAYDT